MVIRMREIKFRAWVKHPHTGEMIMRYSFYTLNSGGEMYCLFPFNMDTKFDSINEAMHTPLPKSKAETVMQFTGLRDKHDKEIYEGDVCDVAPGMGLHYVGHVVFENGGFQIIYKNGGRNEMTTLYHGKGVLVTVIGNIWENGELLSTDTDEKEA